MKVLPFSALSLCAVCCALRAEASPPSWAPSAVTQIDAVSVASGDGAQGRQDLAIGEVPAAIAAIDRPFLDRVVPTCTDNGISFVLHLVSEAQVMLPSHRVSGTAKRLYVDVTKDKKANIYVIEPDGPCEPQASG